MTKSHEHFDYLNDMDYIYQKMIEASRVPKKYFGKEDSEYYKNLIDESDLIEKFKEEELGEPCTEEDLFRQIQEDEREEWSNNKTIKEEKNENRDSKKRNQ